jgi:hypothetical protein
MVEMATRRGLAHGAQALFGAQPTPVRTAERSNFAAVALVFIIEDYRKTFAPLTTCVNTKQNSCRFKSFCRTFARFFANMNGEKLLTPWVTNT